MQTLKLYGPPGTGKTYTLLKYFEEELKKTKPERIGFVTFTRAARLEALSRTSLTEDELPFVKTLHATCYKTLKISQNELVLRKDLQEFGRSIGVHLTGFMPDLFSLEALTEKWQQPTKADRLLQLNHLGRHRGLQLREALKDAPQELDYNYAKWFTQAYRNWKTTTGKVDYTDLLTNYLEHGAVQDLDVLFVDEGQDLSWLQWNVVRKLALNCKRLYLAGDDDQTIFRWAGASASLFNLEPANEVQVLPQSYRLPRVVHELSQKIIRRIRVRQEKEFKPRDYEGEYRPIPGIDVHNISEGTSLVLYRNFHRGTALSLQLQELGVPYTGSNATLANDEVRAALNGWLKITRNEPFTMSEARALTGFASRSYLVEGYRERVEPKTGELSAPAIFNQRAFETEWVQVLHKVPQLAYLRRAEQKWGFESLLSPKVTLLSIHQSKGREADNVVVDLEFARRTYDGYLAEPDDEQRVYYVAVTRTKKRLFTILPQSQMYFQL